MTPSISPFRRYVAEFVGTAFLLMAVVGSGIMAERLADGNVALMLLANSLATGCALIALILVFAPISGAHFNPLVTLAFSSKQGWKHQQTALYITAQCLGAWMGVLCAHIMFDVAVFELSMKDRSGTHLLVSEVVASFGLLAVILSTVRTRAEAVPYAVAAYITAAYWFTSSTSFANPAVTLARAFTDSFTGIAWVNVPGFIIAQLAGMLLAVNLFRWFYARMKA